MNARSERNGRNRKLILKLHSLPAKDSTNLLSTLVMSANINTQDSRNFDFITLSKKITEMTRLQEQWASQLATCSNTQNRNTYSKKSGTHICLHVLIIQGHYLYQIL